MTEEEKNIKKLEKACWYAIGAFVVAFMLVWWCS